MHFAEKERIDEISNTNSGSMHKNSEAMMLSPQSRATRPLLVSSPEGPSRGQKIVSSTSTPKSSGTGKLKHIRKAMKIIKPARHALLDDNKDEEEFRIPAYSSQDTPQDKDLSFSDLMPTELLVKGGSLPTSAHSSAIPLKQPSMSAKAFKDALELQDALTETRIDIDEGDEMSFSDLQPKHLVLDLDAAPAAGQTSQLRATLTSTLLREPSMASTQFRERMEALEAKSKTLMDDDSHNSDEGEGFLFGPVPLVGTLETPPRSGESFSLEGEDSLPGLTHVPEPYFSTPEPYASAEEDVPTTKDFIVGATPAAPMGADLDNGDLPNHSDEPLVANADQIIPKKHSSRNGATSRDSSPLKKALSPKSRKVDSMTRKSGSDVATTTWARPGASSSAPRKADDNGNTIDAENHGATKDKAVKASSKIETKESAVHKSGRNSRRSNRTVDKKVRSRRRSKDSEIHGSNPKLGSPSSSSHLPRRSTSSQKEDGIDRKRHSKRSSTKDSTTKSSSKREGSSSRLPGRQRSRDSSMPPRTRSRDKTSRTRSRDSSLPARPRARDELSRRSKRDSSLPPKTRSKDNGAFPPRSKSRDSSLPPRVRSLDDPMKSSIRHSESRRTKTRKVDSEDKGISESQRKHRSTRRSSALDSTGAKKTSRRLSQRPRRRRSSATSGAISDNSAHKKETGSSGTKQKETADKKEATDCDDGPVESMQLVLDASGTQISCEPTIFSSTHTASTATTSQTTTPHSTGSIRTSRKRTSGGAMPTVSTSSTNSGHRRPTPVTTRMRNSRTAQRLANSRKGKEQSTKKPAKALTPLELLHESCVF